MARSTPSAIQWDILHCPAALYPDALSVLYRRVPAALRLQVITHAIQAAQRGELDLSGLWIVKRRDRVLGTLLTQHLAGRAAALWPPEVLLTWQRGAMAAALIQRGLEHMAQRGVRLVQTLLEPGTSRQASQDLQRGGLSRTTELLYLGRDTGRDLAPPPGTPPLVWSTYQPDTDPRFREVLDATYLQSLDMPELEGARGLDDILASHRASGRFVAQRWQVGEVPGEPEAAALLLLSAVPERTVWDVSYLGLTPQARGRGLGQATLAYAIQRSRPHATRLELAVDVRNIPASRLYQRSGFLPYDRRAVYLAILDPAK